MATTTQIASPAAGLQPTLAQAAALASAAKAENTPEADENVETALAATEPESHEEEATDEPELVGPLALLPVELDVSIPVRQFRVRNLLALEPGALIETQWHNGEDVPLAATNVHLAWCEFEVLDTDLAVRITRIP